MREQGFVLGAIVEPMVVCMLNEPFKSMSLSIDKGRGVFSSNKKDDTKRGVPSLLCCCDERQQRFVFLVCAMPKQASNLVHVMMSFCTFNLDGEIEFGFARFRATGIPLGRDLSTMTDFGCARFPLYTF